MVRGCCSSIGQEDLQAEGPGMTVFFLILSYLILFYMIKCCVRLVVELEHATWSWRFLRQMRTGGSPRCGGPASALRGWSQTSLPSRLQQQVASESFLISLAFTYIHIDTAISSNTMSYNSCLLWGRSPRPWSEHVSSGFICVHHHVLFVLRIIYRSMLYAVY